MEMKKFFTSIAIFVVGWIANRYYEQYKNRIQNIMYSVNKTFLGVSANDNLYGNVEILHDGSPVENLYLCDIIVTNTANKDFEKLQIKVWTVSADNIILRSYAGKKTSPDIISLTEEYTKQANDPNIAHDDPIWSNRVYDIPVLNRDDIVTFSCLVSNNKGEEPNIYLACEQAGLKLKQDYSQTQFFWGENHVHCTIYGVIISAILMIPVLYFVSSKIIASVVIFILGICCMLPGVLILKMMRKIKKSMR